MTADSLTTDLAALGVRSGVPLLVHASLSALGWVRGGAPAVVTALRGAVGTGGTLVVPTFTARNRDPAQWKPAVPRTRWPELRRTMPAFDPRTTPSQDMGAVAEQVRRWPGARRSAHPQTSFAAVGPQADAITRDHDLTCHLGERSPLARLEAIDADVLLLGVGFDRCSCFHLAEYRRPSPRSRTYSCVVRDEHSGNGTGRTWFRYEDVELDDGDFDVIGEAFATAPPGLVRQGKVGAAPSWLFPLAEAVSFATGWMACHRDAGSC